MIFAIFYTFIKVLIFLVLVLQLFCIVHEPNVLHVVMFIFEVALYVHMWWCDLHPAEIGE